jgi:creatinine amidohydrolase
MESKFPFAWTTRNLSKTSVLSLTVATKERASRILESVFDGWVQVIKDIYTFPQPKAW